MAYELWDKKDLRRVLRVAARTLDRIIANAGFPDPIELGPRTKRWRSDQVQAWIESGCSLVVEQQSAESDTPSLSED